MNLSWLKILKCINVDKKSYSISSNLNLWHSIVIQFVLKIKVNLMSIIAGEIWTIQTFLYPLMNVEKHNIQILYNIIVLQKKIPLSSWNNTFSMFYPKKQSLIKTFIMNRLTKLFMMMLRTLLHTFLFIKHSIHYSIKTLKCRTIELLCLKLHFKLMKLKLMIQKIIYLWA